MGVFMEKMYLSDNILKNLNKFIDKYGNDALLTALKDYDILHQNYIYKTKTSIKKIPIASIDFIEIFEHDINIHTNNEVLVKYGTLRNEYTLLKRYGFVKCNQSILVPINKIKEINGKKITLTTGNIFTLSRSCAFEVICAYTKSSSKYNCYN